MCSACVQEARVSRERFAGIVFVFEEHGRRRGES